MKIRSYTYTVLIILITLTCLMSGCEQVINTIVTLESVDKVAIATISEMNASGISGTATFTEIAVGTHVVIEVQNATPGLHGMHLHIGSSCADFGPHWHPMDVAAGTPGISVVQASFNMSPIGRGEVGNILVGEDGTGILEFTTPFWSLGGNPNTDILGKLVIIHETGDTFAANPHAQHMNTQMDIHMESEQQESEPSETTETHPPSDNDTSMGMPGVQPGGGSKIGCGMIVLMD